MLILNITKRYGAVIEHGGERLVVRLAHQNSELKDLYGVKLAFDAPLSFAIAREDRRDP